MKKSLMFLGLMLMAVMAYAQTPSLTVSPQEAMGTTVTIDSVTLDQDGWVVIHALDLNGELVLTPPLGMVYLTAGTHDNVAIDLDPALLQEYDYGMGAKDVVAMVHVDDGDQVYEFPDGPDVPVMVGDQIVVANLSVLSVDFGGMMAMGGDTGGAMMDNSMMMDMTFGDADTDASGDLNEDEFNAMQANMMSMGMMDDTMMSGMAFSDFDTDANGTLSEDEFNAMQANMMSMMGSETGGAMMDNSMMVTDGTYEIELSGSQEVPPVMTDATGSATFTLTGNNLSLTGDFSGLSSPAVEIAGSPGHIHMAAMGENGDVIIPLNVTLAEDGMSGIFSVDATLTPEQTDAIMAGKLYVNFHTEMHQGGELRGQLVPGMMGMSGDMMGETGGAMMGMAFGDLDADANGSLSEDEFNAGMNMDGSMMSGTFADFDTDASGDISEDEYNAMSSMMNMNDSSTVGAGSTILGPDGVPLMAFADFDTNGDGTVDETEFDAAMTLSGSTMSGTFADFDTDGNGTLSEDEYNAMNHR